MNTFIRKQKERVFKDCLAIGITYVVFMIDAPDVEIPEELKHGPGGMGLNFSKGFANALTWGDAAITQRLTFDNSGSFQVVIPWSAVLRIMSKDHSINREWEYEE